MSDCTIGTSGHHGSIRTTFISNNSTIWQSNNITQKTCNRKYTWLPFLLVPPGGILFEVLRIVLFSQKLTSYSRAKVHMYQMSILKLIFRVFFLYFNVNLSDLDIKISNCFGFANSYKNWMKLGSFFKCLKDLSIPPPPFCIENIY